MKVCDLSGALLDYWVLRAEGWVDDRLHDMQLTRNGEYCIAGAAPKHAVGGHCWRSPSTDWAVGGPIVESTFIWLSDEEGRWLASCPPHINVDNGKDLIQFGETPLIAAMRAKVAGHYTAPKPPRQPTNPRPTTSAMLCGRIPKPPPSPQTPRRQSLAQAGDRSY